MVLYIPDLTHRAERLIQIHQRTGIQTQDILNQAKLLARKVNDFELFYRSFEVYQLKKEENQPIHSEWTNVKADKTTLNYNYVVIVGESAPRKSFSYYQGADLSSYKGWQFISDAISPATNTRESIPRILSVNHRDNINTNLNLIDLANQAGLKTAWFSNQGFIGKYDTPISVLAKRANQVVFHNKGSFLTAGSDDKLLVDLKNTLTDGKTGHLVFLHTMGSHPSFCKRTKFYKTHIQDFNSKDERSCFKDAIYNTELYIAEVNTIMKKSNKPYKIVYFSDHGLTDVNYSPYKVHGVGRLFSLDAIHIPLIFIDSESKHTGQLVNKTYYMRDFVDSFFDWTRIKADQIDESKSVMSPNLTQKPYVYEGSRYISLE
ncbi:phosphoethanolamine transferase [Vibrio sp. SS-MA-C1-2]|uniref:phosphoethanolamine transferase n=1 Tax=Vibrio sp. SS-MA-C1-2 TaxID=2908646 RepID=UPI001F2CFAAA|nr:phosphoethanolamine transferase [Vibrio sp. SS-MA-C1-2]UJF17881.1 phosphoethanolamine transferase [Vibrio sp. SS-MA-C1-2]